MKRKIDVPSAPVSAGSRYPEPFAAPCQDKIRRRLALAAGLKQIGINLLELAPGAWSSQRHWHDREDEFIYVVAGEVTLVEEGGETVLRTGDCAAFPKDVANGHQLINKSNAEALVLEVGTRTGDDVTVYPDANMKFAPVVDAYVRPDGTRV